MGLAFIEHPSLFMSLAKFSNGVGAIRRLLGECLKSVLKVSENVSYFCPLTRFQALSKADFLTGFPSVGEVNWVKDHRTVLLISFGSSFK